MALRSTKRKSSGLKHCSLRARRAKNMQGGKKSEEREGGRHVRIPSRVSLSNACLARPIYIFHAPVTQASYIVF